MDESLHTFIALASSFIAPLGLLNHFRMGRVEENDSVLHLTMYFLKFWLETYVLEELGYGVPQAELFALSNPMHSFTEQTFVVIGRCSSVPFFPYVPIPMRNYM